MLTECDKRVPHETRYPSAGSLEWKTMTKRDERMIARAVNFARKREVDYNNHCAIAVRGSKIVAIGFNSYKNVPSALSTEHMRMVPGRNSVMGVGCHAEVAALNQLTDPTGVTIYVVRILKNGEVGNSKPCEGCQVTMKNAGIRKVIWSEESSSEE